MTNIPTIDPNRSCLAIILAAGEGTRMQSAIPKVLHEVGNMPMLGHVINTARASGCDSLAVVVGATTGPVDRYLQTHHPDVHICQQPVPRGTADAARAASAVIERGFDDILVLFADSPNIRVADLQAARQLIAEGASLAVLGFETDTPTGYGRLLTEGNGVKAIREERDSSPEEKKITLCNAGIMAFSGEAILPLLTAITNTNAKSEYYLTDAVEIAHSRALSIAYCVAPAETVNGVNTRRELADAEAVFQATRRRHFLESGVSMLAPETVYFSADTKIGVDTVLEPHLVFGPGVEIAENVRINGYCHLTQCQIGSGCQIGPFARLRPGAHLQDGAKVGNFVEVKNAEIGPGAKVNHLAYVGDSTVGAAANIGAGTIVCNYDGIAKYRTVIGENAFIGSNSSLVAPVSIGAGAMVGSGSVITEDVPDDDLALGRARQINKPGQARAFREKKR